MHINSIELYSAPCLRTIILYNTSMDTLSYSKLRANLKSALDRAVDDHEVIVVERAKGGDAVLLSREDYESLNETAYLLRSPANAKRLLAAVKRSKKARKPFKSLAALKHATGF
jgi:antitoxin YefM